MPSQSTLRIATRQSPLALWQAQHIAAQLRQHWPNLTIELRPMQTSGDKFLKDKLVALGGKGLFVKELEEALLAKDADLAVHSMKDVPAFFPKGLTLAAICKRDNPYDAFLSQHYANVDALPIGATVGTASLRRQSQLLALRPDLNVQPLRGNVQTRMQKLAQGDFDAIILAMAGLERLQLQDKVTCLLPEAIMLPACGQGAIGIECLDDNETIRALLQPLNDPNTALCINTERAVNQQLGGNCHTPVAIFCQWANSNTLHLQAKVLTTDGKHMISHSQQGPKDQAQAMAKECSQILLDKGAGTMVAS